MKDNESSSKKEKVKFDESKNVITEFTKSESISHNLAQKANLRSPTKVPDDEEPVPEKKKKQESKKQMDMDKIVADLKTSEAVI